jgi:hypothetical protein
VIEVSVEDLKRAVSLLLDRVADDGVLRIDHEAFWSVPAPAAYDVYREPSDLTIGMVSESWENIAGIIRDPDNAVDYGLVWVAEVLRAAGDEAST